MTKIIKFKDNTYLYGTLIEEGSNNNGEWEKYSNGKLIQRGTFDVGDISFNTAVGNAYRGANSENIVVINYPLSFINSDNRIFVNIEGNSYLNISCNSTTRYNNRFTAYITSPANTIVRNIKIIWSAEGKWK